MTPEELSLLSDEELMALPESMGESGGTAAEAAGAEVDEAEAAVGEETPETAVAETPTEAPAGETTSEKPADVLAGSDEDLEALDDLGSKAKAPTKVEDKTTQNPLSNAKADTAKAKVGADAVVGDKAKSATEAAESTPVDYKAAYEQIFAPFKANGRQIKLQSPAEVVSLMQMGANYTQKLQALQPSLKLMRMLENNGLLSEEKLTFLIDVNRRDPAAITKLLKEGNIDPLEIDTQAELAYKPGNHRVSDEDMAFVDTIREVNSSPKGAELVREIDRGWDETSKKALWKEPQILNVLLEHRENGIYDKVTAELERRKIFGEHRNTPFLEAYYATAQSLQNQGALTTTKPTAQPVQQQISAVPTQRQGRIVAQRPAAEQPSPVSDKIRAAQPTRAAAQNVQADFNPLAMSDEEFEKSAHLAMRL